MEKDKKDALARVIIASTLALCVVFGASPAFISGYKTVAEAYMLSGD